MRRGRPLKRWGRGCFLGNLAPQWVLNAALVILLRDGLFVVFDDVTVGADAALRLCDAVLRTDWPARGLPSETSIRVGMHAGPVFPADDPLIGRANFFGFPRQPGDTH